jgi:hypothetical protein
LLLLLEVAAWVSVTVALPCGYVVAHAMGSWLLGPAAGDLLVLLAALHLARAVLMRLARRATNIR